MHIVIVNAHWSNRGDEAAHRALWEQLQVKYPNSRITVMIKDREQVPWFPDIPNIEHFSCQFNVALEEILLAVTSRGELEGDDLLNKMVKTLLTADLIIYPPGGSVINDRFYWSKQLEYLVPFFCAKNYDIPMLVIAPSMGPYESENPLRKWLLTAPDAFIVREEISRDYLKDIGITENVHVAIDLAFMGIVDEEKNEQEFKQYIALKKFISSHEKVIGMTISDFKWHVKLGKDDELKGNIEKSFRHFIKYLNEQGYGVLLIPQLFGNQNDYEYLEKFIDGPEESIYVMSEDYDTYFQQYVISKLYAVIGMRYHCNIFAAKMGTPFIAISYEEKMKGFLELSGLEGFLVDIDDVSYELLQESFLNLEKKYSEFKNMLLDKKEGWKNKALSVTNSFPDI